MILDCCHLEERHLEESSTGLKNKTQETLVRRFLLQKHWFSWCEVWTSGVKIQKLPLWFYCVAHPENHCSKLSEKRIEEKSLIVMLSGLSEFLPNKIPLSRRFIASSPFYTLFCSRYCGIHSQPVNKAHVPTCKAKRTSLLDVIMEPWNIHSIVNLYLFGILSFPLFFN